MFTFVFVCDVCVCVCCVSGCNLFCQAQEAMRHAKKGSNMQAMKGVFKAYFEKGAATNEEDVHVSVMCDVGSDVFMHVHICVCM